MQIMVPARVSSVNPSREYRFEGSCGGLDDYILNNEILGKNGCLYSLIEDHSHGGLRTSKGYTDNMLIDS